MRLHDEILFIRDNAFLGMQNIIAKNLNINKVYVHKQLYSLKHENEYDMKVVNEARRLLKQTKNLVYGN